MSRQSRHLALFCLRGKAFNLSLLSVVSCGLLIYGFTILRYILCRFNLLRDFIINRYWILSTIALVSARLSKQSSLPDFIDSLWQGESFPSHSALDDVLANGSASGVLGLVRLAFSLHLGKDTAHAQVRGCPVWAPRLSRLAGWAP